ncbi:MAG: 16S rRNA (cytidine(1402)-2'-O)-methyltransferase [Bacteroidia bacterium]|nr:MAG: 16S rRNA (cytidine(1402)-2'-O)-methyltransferase [Bacteroidia bacterium]
MPGKLYVVPTPIGNLEDITLRAIRVLREVDYILSEDTRTTGKLLKHLEVQATLKPYHLHNEHARVARLAEDIASSRAVALVSDAGTPAISDPGFLLVRECLARGVEVECLPGPTAMIPALVMSGLPCERFAYEGFLPPKKGRQKRLTLLREQGRTAVLYESPHRVLKLLGELAEVYGPAQPLSISREITKLYAENLRGSVEQLIAHFEEQPPKGEFVVVVAPHEPAP